MTRQGDLECPECGKTVPSEEGQHAENLVTGQVGCPHCGASVTLDPAAAGNSTGDVAGAEGAPPGEHEDIDAFAGQETLDDVADELGDKPT
jgi:endogenous inhibitor of DNA gyrase (YacG/DUF329 family)